MFSRIPISRMQLLRCSEKCPSLLRRLASISAAHPPTETKTARRLPGRFSIPRGSRCVAYSMRFACVSVVCAKRRSLLLVLNLTT
jgi:hypothetical protein